VVWQHVIGMVCVLLVWQHVIGMVFVLWCAACHRYGVCTVVWQHAALYVIRVPYNVASMLPHYHITYNEVFFTEFLSKHNFS